jgi:hypothetical protein
MGHARLSIIDLATADMPLAHEDAQIPLTWPFWWSCRESNPAQN